MREGIIFFLVFPQSDARNVHHAMRELPQGFPYRRLRASTSPEGALPFLPVQGKAILGFQFTGGQGQISQKGVWRFPLLRGWVSKTGSLQHTPLQCKGQSGMESFSNIGGAWHTLLLFNYFLDVQFE